MKLAIKISFLVLLILSGLIFLVYKMVSSEEDVMATLPKINQISSFSLTDQDGQVFTEKNLEGKVWVVDFIFTRCQGPCPLMTDKMAELSKEFAEDQKVHFVTITMDSRYDTPGVLKEFGESREADFSRWHFLTGETDNILSIARNIFKVPADKDPEMHTTRFVLVDSDGFIRSYYDSLETESYESLRKALHSLKKK